jgi:hypothetical protein
VAGFLLFYPAMRGISRNIAFLLALWALAVAGSARVAEARGARVGAAAAKMTRGAQLKLNRMKAKMSLRAKGMQKEKTRRQLRLGKKQLQRAMSRRDSGLKTSETDRTRSAFARNLGDAADHGPGPNATSRAAGFKTDEVTQEHLEESSSAKQRKKMRDRVRKATTPPKKKIPKRRRD